ncbi:MAG: hypothetical protein L6420_08030 [Elusimicrobia bacterium]|nr:hypothetical protein [Elusimicrobiota bacterium]
MSIKIQSQFSRKQTFLFVLTLLFLWLYPQILYSETLTLTTYYPSPYGGYAKLLTTDLTVLARDGGRVGVGTASPGNILEIRSSQDGMGLDVNNTGAGASKIRFKRNGASKWTIADGYPASGYLSIFNNSASKAALVVDQTNNIGIGTESPKANLDVAGNIKISANSSVCDAGHAGEIRWTGTDFEGCKGSGDWQSLGGGLGWEDITTDTAPFDGDRCEYRWKCVNGQHFYPTNVRPNFIMMDYSAGNYQIVRSVNKARSSGDTGTFAARTYRRCW